MLLVGRPQSFLESNPARLLNDISGKKNTSQEPSFLGCSSPLDTANHYASYLHSYLSQAIPRTSRRAERQFINELRKASCDDASFLHNSFCSPFSLAELSTATSKLSSSTASGPHQIAYPLLKHLPELAQLLLFSLFNRSWSSHNFPSCWKPTTIIRIHKPGKPTSSPSSFRSISLTSCISKLFQRLILIHLTFHLKSNHLLSTCQAGFHPGWSSLDQILTLSQSIWDGFQKKKPPDWSFWRLLTSPRLSTRSGTLLCFINFSRSNSPLASFFGYSLSFLPVELKSKLVVPAAFPSVSDEISPRGRYLVQASSSYLLMTLPRICLGVLMPPCMLTIWLSGPPTQTRSKHLLSSNPP